METIAVCISIFMAIYFTILYFKLDNISDKLDEIENEIKRMKKRKNNHETDN